MNRAYLYIISSLLLVTSAMQATDPQHYIDIHAGAGVGSWGYTLNGGSTKVGNNYSAGAGYTWFFTPNVGLQVGLQAARLSSYAMLSAPIEYGQLTDYQGDTYTHRVSFTDWREQQQAWFIELPLGLRFRHFAHDDSRAGLHAAVGVSLALPVHATAHTTGTVTHSGYYDYWQLTLHDLPGRFMTESIDRSSSISRQLSTFNALLYAEIGTTIRLTLRSQLTIAAYARYGLTEFSAVKRADRTPLGFANADNGYTFMPEYKGLIGTDKISSLAPWAAGVKLCLSVWPGQTDEQKKQLLLRLAAEFPDVLPCPPEN